MNIPCKILLAAAAFGLIPAAAMAQSSYYGISPFEGAYVGGYGGAMTNPDMNGTLGGIAGANFSVTDGIMVGAEAQGGATFGSTTTYDAMMLGHVGYEVDDQMLVYGKLGAGMIDGTGSYAVGGGAETMLVDQIGVRGELLGTGAWGEGPSAAKVTAGVLWHMR